MYKFELLKTEISVGKAVTLFCNTAATLFGFKIKIYLQFYSNEGLEKTIIKSAPYFIQKFMLVSTGLLCFRKNMVLYFL